MTPLTHHDIVRLGAPLVRAGWRLDQAGTDRAERRMVFRPADDSPPAMRISMTEHEERLDLIRAVAGRDGLVATLSIRTGNRAAELTAALEAFASISTERQLPVHGEVHAAFDHVLASIGTARTPDPPAQGEDSTMMGAPPAEGAQLVLRSAELRVRSLRLHVDASTGAGMPADAFLEHAANAADRSRDVLASGARSPARESVVRLVATLSRRETTSGPANRANDLVPDARACLQAVPDDLLAVASPRFRAMRWRGDHWRSSLAALGRGPARSARVEAALGETMIALDDFVADPHRWHERHRARRWRVWFARLKPAMMLGAILAVAPLAWLLVHRGGVVLNPLALGLAPLLMVGLLVLGSREIPVIEWPPRPRPVALPGNG